MISTEPNRMPPTACRMASTTLKSGIVGVRKERFLSILSLDIATISTIPLDIVNMGLKIDPNKAITSPRATLNDTSFIATTAVLPLP
jgi:hypothetical protein